MYTLKIPSEITNTDLQNLLCHETRKTEVREKTYRVVSLSCRAFHLRTSKKTKNTRNFGTIKSLNRRQEHIPPRRLDETKNKSRAETTEKNCWQLWSLLWKSPEKYNFGTIKNVGDIERRKKGTLKNGAEYSSLSPKCQGVLNKSYL